MPESQDNPDYNCQRQRKDKEQKVQQQEVRLNCWLLPEHARLLDEMQNEMLGRRLNRRETVMQVIEMAHDALRRHPNWRKGAYKQHFRLKTSGGIVFRGWKLRGE